MASSAAPDDNNIGVMGVNAEDMSMAVNHLIKNGGGQIFVADGEILEFLPLPVGGIVSDEEPELKEVYIGELPLMLKSSKCHLNGLSYEKKISIRCYGFISYCH